MKYTLTSIIVLVSFFNHSQHTFIGAPRFDWLEGTTVSIELSGDAAMDSIIYETAEELWTYGKYLFITPDSNGVYNHNKGHMVIGLMGIKYGLTEHLDFAYYYPDDINVTRLKNVLATVPVDCVNQEGIKNPLKVHFPTECSLLDIKYKYNILFRQLVEVIEFCKLKEYKPTYLHYQGVQKYYDWYNEYSRKHYEILRFKPILISDEMLSYSVTEKDVKNAYHHQYKIVGREEYMNIIEANDTSYFYVLFGKAPQFNLCVYDPANNVTLFSLLNKGKFSTYEILNIKKKHITAIDDHLAALLKNGKKRQKKRQKNQ